METKEILNRISILIEEITDIHIRIRTEAENIKDIDLQLMNNKSIEFYDYIQKLKQLDIISSKYENYVESKKEEKSIIDIEKEVEQEKVEITTNKNTEENLKETADKSIIENQSESKKESEEEKNINNTEENELKKEAQQSHLFEQEESDQKEAELETDNQDDEGSSNNDSQESDNEVIETVQESVKSENTQTDDKNSQNKTSINERFSGMYTSSLNEKFSRENMNRMLADKLKLTPVSDLKSAISINQQAAFIDQLFKGNKKDYKRSIEFLNKCGNYSEAKFYIHSELSNKYQWKVDNKLVEELIELVYRRFL